MWHVEYPSIVGEISSGVNWRIWPREIYSCMNCTYRECRFVSLCRRRSTVAKRWVAPCRVSVNCGSASSNGSSTVYLPLESHECVVFKRSLTLTFSGSWGVVIWESSISQNLCRVAWISTVDKNYVVIDGFCYAIDVITHLKIVEIAIMLPCASSFLLPVKIAHTESVPSRTSIGDAELNSVPASGIPLKISSADASMFSLIWAYTCSEWSETRDLIVSVLTPLAVPRRLKKCRKWEFGQEPD